MELVIHLVLLGVIALSQPHAQESPVDPDRRPAPILTAQVGHVHAVNKAVTSADGRFLLTGNTAGTAFTGEVSILWEVETGRQLMSLPPAQGLMEISHDGSLILLGTQSGLAVWSSRDHDLLVEIPFPMPGGPIPEGVRGDLARTSGGESVFISLFDPARQGWNPGPPKRWESWAEHLLLECPISQRNATCVELLRSRDGAQILERLSPSGEKLITVSEGQEGGGYLIEVWKLPSFSLALSIEEDEVPMAISFSPDESQITSYSENHETRWSLASGERTDRIAHPSISERIPDSLPSIGMSISERGGFLFEENSGVYPGGAFEQPETYAATGVTVVAMRDLLGDEGIRKFDGETLGLASGVFSPDGGSLLFSAWGASAREWSLAEGRQIKRFKANPVWALGAAFSPDGGWVATGDGMGWVKKWYRSSQEEGWSLRVGAKVVDVDLSPSGEYMAVASGSGASLWEFGQGDPRRVVDYEDTNVSEPLGSVIFTPNGGSVLIWNGRSVRLHPVLGSLPDAVFGEGPDERSAVPSTTGSHVLVFKRDSTALLRRIGTEETITINGPIGAPTDCAVRPDGNVLATAETFGPAKLWDLDSGTQTHVLEPPSYSLVTFVEFSPDGRLVFTSGSEDTGVRVWDAASGQELATLISFRNGDWAVVDPEGRFDGSNGGDVQGLHWVVGTEPIALSQLKDRYYEPGLLAKVLGYNPEPLRDVEAFTEHGLDLYPEVTANWTSADSATLGLEVSDQGGGIGRVEVLINGKEVVRDARGEGFDPDASEINLTLDIAGNPLLMPDTTNNIEIRAYNAEGYLVSRGTTIHYRAPPTEESIPPTLWAVVVGVSDYAGDRLDLRFAEKDADDFAEALEVGAHRLFGADRTRIITLSGGAGTPPTRENIVSALKSAQAAQPTDVLVVYFAGHGVTHGGVDGEFYYLTREALSGDLRDSALRNTVAISAAELTELIKEIPALKQILILDTCHSGRLVEDLTGQREVPSSQIRSLERMKDRTGLFVLAGSAADAVSYEASRYGQGLLTYSLLMGMRGAALRDDAFVDVSQWFGYAVDRVPELAEGIGGVQRPLLAVPRGGASFDVGRIPPEVRDQIPLATEKPLVLRSSFQEERRPRDGLGLTQKVNDRLRAISSRGAEGSVVFVDTDYFPEAYQLAGRYRVDGADVTVRVFLYLGEAELDVGTFLGGRDRLDDLVEEVVNAVEERMGHR